MLKLWFFSGWIFEYSVQISGFVDMVKLMMKINSMVMVKNCLVWVWMFRCIIVFIIFRLMVIIMKLVQRIGLWLSLLMKVMVMKVVSMLTRLMIVVNYSCDLVLQFMFLKMCGVQYIIMFMLVSCCIICSSMFRFIEWWKLVFWKNMCMLCCGILSCFLMLFSFLLIFVGLLCSLINICLVLVWWLCIISQCGLYGRKNILSRNNVLGIVIIFSIQCQLLEQLKVVLERKVVRMLMVIISWYSEIIVLWICFGVILVRYSGVVKLVRLIVMLRMKCLMISILGFQVMLQRIELVMNSIVLRISECLWLRWLDS